MPCPKKQTFIMSRSGWFMSDARASLKCARSTMTKFRLICPLQNKMYYNDIVCISWQSLFVYIFVSCHTCFRRKGLQTNVTLKGWWAERHLKGHNQKKHLLTDNCCNDCTKLVVLEAMALSLNTEISNLRTRLQQQ